MQETYSSMIQACQDLTRDNSPQAKAFFKKTINQTMRMMYTSFQRYKNEKVSLTTSEAGKKYYANPPGFIKIVSIKVRVSDGCDRVLTHIDSQEEWDKLTSAPTIATNSPTYYFQRNRNFGIYPIIQKDGLPIFVTYSYLMRDLQHNDYSSGKVSATEDSNIIVGIDTQWEADMANRWLKIEADGYWYRIAKVIDAQKLELETYYEGRTVVGDYVIGECPELPPEVHHLIPYNVAQVYYTSYRKDINQAIIYSNLFYTEDASNQSRSDTKVTAGFIGARKRYATRQKSAVINPRASYDIAYPIMWEDI